MIFFMLISKSLADTVRLQKNVCSMQGTFLSSLLHCMRWFYMLQMLLPCSSHCHRAAKTFWWATTDLVLQCIYHVEHTISVLFLILSGITLQIVYYSLNTSQMPVMVFVLIALYVAPLAFEGIFWHTVPSDEGFQDLCSMYMHI